MGAVDVAIDHLKREEGLRLEAYPDPASGGDPWTIGYGATGPDIRRGTVWTRQQAEDDLERRVTEIAQQIEDACVESPTDNQLVALIILTYNIGIGRADDPDTPQNEGRGLLGSTLLRLFNAGDIQGAADQFVRWNKAAGRVNPSLTKRRLREQAIFLAPDA